MAKRKGGGGYMAPAEQIAGTVLLVLYLAVLPVVTDPLFDLAERLLGLSISAAVRNVLFYYLLFAAALLIFYRFLGRTTRNFADNLGPACRSILMGLVALYGLNELAYRVFRVVLGSGTNLNDVTISAQVADAPRTTFLIVVFLAPFVEEVLFRGLVFGGLKGKSRTVAYVAACGLFALSHVWQFALVEQSAAAFALMLQYLVPGAVLCRAYESSGSLWSAIAVHAAANALCLWTVG